MTKQRLALLFLILLRIAIGWHFFFEAWEKKRSVDIGPTETNRPWTSEGYFREANGPLAVFMRKQLGDLDEQALARMTVRPVAEGTPIEQKLPAALDAEWNAYFARFAQRYGLNAEQMEKAKAKLLEEKQRTAVWFTAEVPSVEWLLAGLITDADRKPFKRTYPSDSVVVHLTVAERVDEYRAKLNEYHLLTHEKLAAMGKDVEKAHRAAMRGEVIALRTELTDLVNGRTNEMKQALASELSPEQKSLGTVPEPAPNPWPLIWVVDYTTRWGLLIIGACLMLGFFSRTAAFGGAMFLLMTILTTPALPWLPSPPMSEGNYVFVSKNVIEMLALLLLAFTPTGRWFGIDALIHAINPWRKSAVKSKVMESDPDRPIARSWRNRR